MNNKLIVFTGPSGVGKATIEKELFKDKSLRLKFSISATTRQPRPGEIDGVHYHFLSKEVFNQKIANGEFLEWNEHFTNRYGTLKSEVDKIMAEGFNPFIEVEVIGAENLIERYGKNNVISIFIAPPSITELRERMTKRSSETEEQINERIARVDLELSKLPYFDHVVVNDEVLHAVKQIKRIIEVGN